MLKLKIDMHVHSFYSKDALAKPESIVKIAKKKGLSGIAITEHNNAASWAAFEKLAKKEDFFLVKGEEIKVTEHGRKIGELLCYFLHEEILPGELSEVLDAVNAQQGLVFIAHPFDFFRNNWKKMGYWKKFNGLEAFNSRCLLNSWNSRATAFAKEHDFPIIAGSDAHVPFEVGNAFIECNATNAEELRKAILKKKVTLVGRLSNPLVHGFSTIAKLHLMKPF